MKDVNAFKHVSAFYCVVRISFKFEYLLHWNTLADETHLLALRLSGSNLRQLEVIYINGPLPAF